MSESKAHVCRFLEIRAGSSQMASLETEYLVNIIKPRLNKVIAMSGQNMHVSLSFRSYLNETGVRSRGLGLRQCWCRPHRVVLSMKNSGKSSKRT